MTDETVKSTWNMCCPKCGKDDSIIVLAEVQVNLCTDGTDICENTDTEWDDNSPCHCRECGHRGTVGDFGVKEDEQPEKPSFQLFDFDAFEVHGCREFHEGNDAFTQQVDDHLAQFWTVYGHYSPESGQVGVEALVDCTDPKSAQLVQKLLTVLLAGQSKSWVANAGITSDIEALRKICLEHADWWNEQASKVLS